MAVNSTTVRAIRLRPAELGRSLCTSNTSPPLSLELENYGRSSPLHDEELNVLGQMSPTYAASAVLSQPWTSLMVIPVFNLRLTSS